MFRIKLNKKDADKIQESLKCIDDEYFLEVNKKNVIVNDMYHLNDNINIIIKGNDRIHDYYYLKIKERN